MKKPLYILPYSERMRLHKRAYRAQQRDQTEVCGVLLFNSSHRIRLYFLENKSKEEGKYEVYIKDIRAVFREARLSGLGVLGTFHSHPISEVFPSKSDLLKGFYRGVEMIYDVCGREVKLWRRIGKREFPIGYKDLGMILETRKQGAKYR